MGLSKVLIVLANLAYCLFTTQLDHCFWCFYRYYQHRGDNLQRVKRSNNFNFRRKEWSWCSGISGEENFLVYLLLGIKNRSQIFIDKNKMMYWLSTETMKLNDVKQHVQKIKHDHVYIFFLFYGARIYVKNSKQILIMYR